MAEVTELMTPEQVGEVLQLSKSKVYELIRRKKLVTIQIGRARRVTAASVQAFIDEKLNA